MKIKTIFFTLVVMLATISLVFQSCKKDEEKTNEPPTCEITSPSSGQEILQGETITISVEANDSDGNIKEISFAIDGVDKGSASSYPYNYNWTTNNEIIGLHTIKATSIDYDGGSSYDEVTVELIEGGDPPTALFTVSPSSGTQSTNFAFDASGSTNPEDSTADLQVRWDFEGDGIWDTDWNTNKTENYQYSSEGTYSAKLEVRNTEGLTSQYAKSITVNNSGSFTDPRDGQTYATIEIGTQIWFAENLNYTISTMFGYNSWTYNDDSANGDIYGRLYNWDAAKVACPSGWGLPSDEEWNILVEFLGGSDVAGGKMKEAGTTHWNSINTGTNSSGFTALPGGERVYLPVSYYQIGTHGYWWTKTSSGGVEAYQYNIYSGYDEVRRGFGYIKGGLSVRCIKY